MISTIYFPERDEKSRELAMQKLLQKNLPQLNLFVSTANSGKDNTTASTLLAQCNSVTPHQLINKSG